MLHNKNNINHLREKQNCHISWINFRLLNNYKWINIHPASNHSEILLSLCFCNRSIFPSQRQIYFEASFRKRAPIFAFVFREAGARSSDRASMKGSPTFFVPTNHEKLQTTAVRETFGGNQIYWGAIIFCGIRSGCVCQREINETRPRQVSAIPPEKREYSRTVFRISIEH